MEHGQPRFQHPTICFQVTSSQCVLVTVSDSREISILIPFSAMNLPPPRRTPHPSESPAMGSIVQVDWVDKQGQQPHPPKKNCKILYLVWCAMYSVQQAISLQVVDCRALCKFKYNLTLHHFIYYIISKHVWKNCDIFWRYPNIWLLTVILLRPIKGKPRSLGLG